MSSMLVLERIELTPVVELDPSRFAVQSRPTPTGASFEAPEEWHRYWLESLADSNLEGLTPLRPGAWKVPTTEFADPERLRRLLEVTFQHWGGGAELLSKPDIHPVLDGGLALCCRSEGVLIEPTCCADLGNIADWREAADYRSPEWRMLWIGHPWISVKYEPPKLILSDLHESETPTARWTITPDELQRAVKDAQAELERFAQRIAAVLIFLGYEGDSDLISRKLAGLDR